MKTCFSLCLVMIQNVTVSNCTANKSVTVSWKINQTLPDDVLNIIYLESSRRSNIYSEFDKVRPAFF